MRIALQMDPIEAINIDGDSTFLIGLGAQECGHQLFYYQPKHLQWEKGQLTALIQPITLRREKGNHFTAGPATRVVLEDAVDVILLRQDPPFHMGYLTTTYLLEQITHKVRVLNDPTGVRNAPEKMLITHFPHLMPETLVTSEADAIHAFAARHPDIIAKRLYGHGGRDVYRYTNDEKGLAKFASEIAATTGEPIMLQAFLPEIVAGDKRIILYNGEVLGGFRRVPAKGNFLANLAQGGSAEAVELSKRDLEICAAVGPTLKKMGLYFTGLDVIGDYLIEINVTSPTGLAAMNRLYDLKGDKRMEIEFWNRLPK